ncbi:MAG: TlpA disulfide reductase family protein [Candidatus Omnitrophota bacterium]|jgi:peroxiredoxin
MPILRTGRRAVLCFIVFLTCFCARPEAYAATLDSLSGGQVSLDQYKGSRPVLLFFWTTWCPYCRDEIKHLNKISEELKDEGIAPFAVNIGESSYKVNRFFKDYALKISVLLDKDGYFSESQDIAGVPTYIMFDKNGREIFRDNVFPKEFKSLIVK